MHNQKFWLARSDLFFTAFRTRKFRKEMTSRNPWFDHTHHISGVSKRMRKRTMNPMSHRRCVFQKKTRSYKI